MFTFGHLKNVYFMQNFSKSARDVLLSLIWQVKIFLRSHEKFYFCYL